MTAWVILGCGYVGERLAARLRERGPVIATTRREARAAALRAQGIDARVVDPFEPGAIDAVIPAQAIVIDSIPPDPDRGAHGYDARGARRIVYLSSTGVYGRGDGGWVDEETPVSDETPRARGRLAAEAARFAAAPPAVALRIAAIYGPGRGVHARLRGGKYAVTGDGANWVSRIHVDDLVTIIVAAGSVDPLPRGVYLVADDEPTTARAHADGVAAMMGLPPPPSEPAAGDNLDLRMSNRRVRNSVVKRELGVTLRYPTWREGAHACLEEERRGPLP